MSGGDPVVLALTYGGGRWNALGSTRATLPAPATGSPPGSTGLAAGTVTLQLHGAETAAKAKAPKAR